jgi:hypothetical protein
MPQDLRKAGEHYRKIKSFVKKIQQSPEPVKKRWLFILSTISMILILTLWFIYLNVSMPTTVKKNPAAAGSEKTGEDFGEIMERGFKKIREDFWGKWSTFMEDFNKILSQLKSQLDTKNEIIIPEKKFEYVPPPIDTPTSTLIH